MMFLNVILQKLVLASRRTLIIHPAFTHLVWIPMVRSDVHDSSGFALYLRDAHDFAHAGATKESQCA